jgi:CheY-like chemotaxis protein
VTEIVADILPTILVVEDDARALEHRVAALGDAGCIPIGVSSHFDATRELTTSPQIDLVLTDIHLGTIDGDQSGVDLARYIRRTFPGLPVVGYSAYFADDDLANEGDVFDAVWSKGQLTAIDQMIDDAVGRAAAYRSRRGAAMPQGSAEAAEAGKKMKVFLCHASEDKSTVETWYDVLQARGYEPWLDARQFLPGDDWDYEIKLAVESADVVVVALSARSVNKVGYVQKEIRLVLDAANARPQGQTFIIPARLDDTPVPRVLQRWQWVDARDDLWLERLVLALEKLRPTLGDS